METPNKTSYSTWRLPKVIVLTWISMIGIDFLVNGGLLAGIYDRSNPFLLSPSESFRLIPLGFASLSLLAILLTWLMAKVNPKGWLTNLKRGIMLGLLTSGSSFLGLLSILSIDVVVLLELFAGQWLAFVVGGVVAGSGLAAKRLGPLTWKVIVLFVVSFVLTVILQSSMTRALPYGI